MENFLSFTKSFERGIKYLKNSLLIGFYNLGKFHNSCLSIMFVLSRDRSKREIIPFFKKMKEMWVLHER